ncbi:MAG: AAA family ATPase [Patescibacteria group bacterium]
MSFSQSLSLTRNYDYDYRDLAIAFKAVAEDKFGDKSLRGIRVSKLSFSRYGVFTVEFESGFRKRASSVLGSVEIKNLPGYFVVCHKEAPTISACEIPRDRLPEVEKFLDTIGTYLDKNSIYRGKALKLSLGGLEFLDLSSFSFSEKEVVYNPAVKRDLAAHLWAFIENPLLCAERGLPKQHKVLLQGAYGSGKTLTAYVLAKKATKCGWTVIYVAPSIMKEVSLIPYAFELSRFYPPAVIFIEDADHEQHEESPFVFRQIVAQLDGIDTKGFRGLVVMTTTRSKNIKAVMQRPGRIDKAIKLDTFDEKDIKALLQIAIKPELLEEGIDWDEVVARCHNFSPAFVKAVAENANFLAIGENAPKITQEHLMSATEDLRPRFDSCIQDLGLDRE